MCQVLLICMWLLRLSIVHMVYISSLFLLVAEQWFFVWLKYNLFIHLPSMHLGAHYKNTSMNALFLGLISFLIMCVVEGRLEGHKVNV